MSTHRTKYYNLTVQSSEGAVRLHSPTLHCCARNSCKPTNSYKEVHGNISAGQPQQVSLSECIFVLGGCLSSHHTNFEDPPKTSTVDTTNRLLDLACNPHPYMHFLDARTHDRRYQLLISIITNWKVRLRQSSLFFSLMSQLVK